MNYHRIYLQLIEAAKRRTAPLMFTEKHHILPKSLGGDNTLQNIAILTFREHFIAHYLLTKFTNGNDKIKMQFAFGMMSMHSKTNNYRSQVSSRLFNASKIAATESRNWLNSKSEGVCKGRKWYSDGEQLIRLKPDDPRIEQLSLTPFSLAGRKWYTDGINFMMLFPNDPRCNILTPGAPAKGKPKNFSKAVCDDRRQMIWFNDGVKNTKLKPDDIRAANLHKGRLRLSDKALQNIKDGTWVRTPEHNKQNSERQKGGMWFNDGIKNIMKKPTEQIQPHWVRGRIEHHHPQSNV